MNTRHLDIPETIFAFAVPLLPARDVDATVAFFESVLGFRRSHARGAPTEFAAIKRAAQAVPTIAAAYINNQWGLPAKQGIDIDKS